VGGEKKGWRWIMLIKNVVWQKYRAKKIARGLRQRILAFVSWEGQKDKRVEAYKTKGRRERGGVYSAGEEGVGSSKIVEKYRHQTTRITGQRFVQRGCEIQRRSNATGSMRKDNLILFSMFPN